MADKEKEIIAIVLAGSRDFGRFTLASRLPTVLWPILDKTVLERLLEHLANQGIKKSVICLTLASASDTKLSSSLGVSAGTSK